MISQHFLSASCKCIVQEEGGEEPDLLPERGSGKAKAKPVKAGKKANIAPTAMQEDGEDVLQDYELSDDDRDME